MNVMIQVIQSLHFPGAGSVMMFNSRPRFSSSRSSRDSRLALSSNSPIFSLRSPSSVTCSVGSMSGARRVSAAAIAASAAATTLAPFSNRVEPVCEEMEILSTRVSFWCRERAKRVNQRRGRVEGARAVPSDKCLDLSIMCDAEALPSSGVNTTTIGGSASSSNVVFIVIWKSSHAAQNGE